MEYILKRSGAMTRLAGKRIHRYINYHPNQADSPCKHPDLL